MKRQRQQRHLLTKAQYYHLVKKAEEFAGELSGDAGYEKSQINRIALESMLVGWMTAQPYYAEYEAYCAEHHTRENVLLLAQDQALQAASDAVENHYRFATK